MVSVDVNRMVAIKTVAGQPEETRPLTPGKEGYAECMFDGVIHSTDTPNLFFSIAAKAAARPKTKAKGKAKAKAKGKAKAKAKGKAPAAADSQDEGEGEESEEEECEGDEEVEPDPEDEVEKQDADETMGDAIAPPLEDGADDGVEEPAVKKAKQVCFFIHVIHVCIYVYIYIYIYI